MVSRNSISIESDAQRALRRNRRDGRDDENLWPVAYITESGEVVGWSGDEEAPYVKPLPSKCLWKDSNALISTQVVKPRPGILYQAHIYHTKSTQDGGVKYEWQLHDSATVPATGAVPKMVLPLFPGGTIALGYGELRGRDDFKKGITWVLSTAPDTYQPAVNADVVWSTVGYR